MQGAEVGLVHNEGGILSSHCTMILSNEKAECDDDTAARKPRGKYFEDFAVGEEIVTPARTVTSTDIVNFACISGDFNEVHVNYEYCKTTPFGEPIAHGPLVYAIAGGLCSTPAASTTARSSRCWASTTGACSTRSSTATRSACMARVVEKKETSKPDRGVVVFDRRCVKQDGTVAQTMKTTLMYQRRPAQLTTGRARKQAMNFTLSPEIEAVRDMVNRFMENEVVPVMDDYEKRREFPRELVRKAGEAGLYGAVFPESVGGSNMGYLAAAVIQEEMVAQRRALRLVQQPAGLAPARAASTSAARRSRSRSTCPTCSPARPSA